MNEKLKKLIECCDLTDVGIENLLRYINYDVKSLIQPQDLNLQWDKCAIIITKMGFQVVKPFLIDLFEWLQDMNWPGALTIRNFLLTIPKDEFKQLSSLTKYNHTHTIEASKNEILDEIIEILGEKGIISN